MPVAGRSPPPKGARGHHAARHRARPAGDAGPPPTSRARRHRFSRRLWAVVGALGILGTVGGYVTTLALNSVHDRLTEPLKVDVRDTTSSPNDLFSTGDASAGRPDRPERPARRTRSGAGPPGSTAIPYGDVSQQLILRGRDPQTVVVQEIRVKVVDRAPTPSGRLGERLGRLRCGPPGPAGRGRLRRGAATGGSDRRRRQSNGTVFSITDTSVEVFDVDVYAGSDLVSWVFEVRYSSAGRDGVVTVDDNGKPFRVAGGGARRSSRRGPDPTRLTEDAASSGLP